MGRDDGDETRRGDDNAEGAAFCIGDDDGVDVSDAG